VLCSSRRMAEGDHQPCVFILICQIQLQQTESGIEMADDEGSKSWTSSFTILKTRMWYLMHVHNRSCKFCALCTVTHFMN
jgi:hypothetical protein